MAGNSARILALLSLLQTQRDWPGQVLADRLDVTPRTIRRDIDRLREMGYQVGASKGPAGGYRLAAGSELPPLLFDDDQAVAIAVALQNVPSSGVDIEEAAARALATVRQVMPSRLRHRIDGIQFIGTASRARVDSAVVEAVSDAVQSRMTLRFEYRGSGHENGENRRVQPHGIVARDGLWYLVAWDPAREDWRTFRLDRMVPRIPTGPTFEPRPIPFGDAGSFLASRAKGSKGQDRWPCMGTVLIELSAREVAPWVSDGEVVQVSERSCLLTVGSWSWVGLIALVLRFDAPFRIVEPKGLVDATGTLAQRLVESAPR